MTRFVGRDRELETLEHAHRSRRGAFVVVYGRRRVGKTALLRRFVTDRPAIYLHGTRAPRELQVRELLREAAAVLSEPLLERVGDLSWKEALTACVERHHGSDKLVLVLDEFQWLADTSPELMGVLQELWDRHWQHDGKVMVVLCGSFVGFMEREVLGRKSPLFGRRTAQILLRPFDYRQAAAFHPSYAVADKAKAYFVCGGIPHYLRLFDAERSVEQNIAAQILHEHGPLFREADFLLREELREVESYWAILVRLAKGAATPGDLASDTPVGQSVHYYLKQLVELGYVERVFPLTRRRPKLTDVRYRLADPMLRFWFRFVQPNQSFLQRYGGKRGLRERIKPQLDAYFGGAFERLCRQGVLALHDREGVDGPTDVGSFWSKEVQIDVVALRADDWIELAECKWGRVRSAGKLVDELEAKVPLYPNPRGHTVVRRLFTSKPIARAEDTAGLRWHTLDDLYE
ncbi:MAG: ATP-binding protein [Polyangiaceae bacterium]